ncbi:hypothetical protein JOB18_009306 [Solea senegalensis]|uniref:Uncharacterized protein n=1 Tax=Solea senegalensis TaxID=28829 RepID=A0AAV6Q1A8_SOLSE|nr:hypothetical protein JOB18_009306 [Solea senegalensis]
MPASNQCHSSRLVAFHPGLITESNAAFSDRVNKLKRTPSGLMSSKWLKQPEVCKSQVRPGSRSYSGKVLGRRIINDGRQKSAGDGEVRRGGKCGLTTPASSTA